MRAIVDLQLPLDRGFVDHPRGVELRLMSETLDRCPEISRLAHSDLTRGRSSTAGRPGLSGDQAVRVLVLKQLTGFSFEALAFHLADSRSYRSFCRFGLGEKALRKSALQATLSKLSPSTLREINDLLIQRVVEDGLDKGDKVRVDTTVTESNIHYPTDSSLLWDSVRVLVRLMKQARTELGLSFVFRDRTRASKRRVYKINQARRQAKRLPHYRDLVRFCEKTVSAAKRLLNRLQTDAGEKHRRRLEHHIELAERVIDQTRRRVWSGESVPAGEKVVSIFEEHTDVIVKGGREVEYGHKLCLTVGRSTLVFDCSIEDGAPADSTLAIDSIRRLTAITGETPSQVAMDSGFSSVANLRELKGLGVSEVMFHRKKPLLDTSLMTSTPAIHKELWRFRAGVEGCVSFLKRCFGLRRATWKGRTGFHRFIRASVLAANLLTVARLDLRREAQR